MKTKSVILGITGASGIPLAFRLLQELIINEIEVSLVISQAGMITVKQEVELSLSSNPNTTHDILCKYLDLHNHDNLNVYGINDWFSPIASGSSVTDAMVICPCSMTTLGKLATGIGDDLLLRAADVILKERKNLVIVPRETPLSAIHLENMHKLATLGVCILPPVPAFYTHPTSVNEIIDFLVSRILDQLGVDNTLSKRWGK